MGRVQVSLLSPDLPGLHTLRTASWQGSVRSGGGKSSVKCGGGGGGGARGSKVGSCAGKLHKYFSSQQRSYVELHATYNRASIKSVISGNKTSSTLPTA